MKVVLDTNVFVSAFLWQRNVKEIFNLAKQKKFQICATKEILNEFEKVLKYSKFSKKLKSINKEPPQIINEFLEVVKLYPSRKLKTPIIREDPTDDKFLVCTLSCKASFIVSGNKHLLNLKDFQGIPILTPIQFLSRLKK